MADQATFCANDMCEFFEVKATRNSGDCLRQGDGTVVKRNAFVNTADAKTENGSTRGQARPRMRLFCDACANAIRLARWKDDRG